LSHVLVEHQWEILTTDCTDEEWIGSIGRDQAGDESRSSFPIRAICEIRG
jgi:hypothetical protein